MATKKAEITSQLTILNLNSKLSIVVSAYARSELLREVVRLLDPTWN